MTRQKYQNKRQENNEQETEPKPHVTDLYNLKLCVVPWSKNNSRGDRAFIMEQPAAIY